MELKGLRIFHVVNVGGMIYAGANSAELSCLVGNSWPYQNRSYDLLAQLVSQLRLLSKLLLRCTFEAKIRLRSKQSRLLQPNI